MKFCNFHYASLRHSWSFDKTKFLKEVSKQEQTLGYFQKSQEIQGGSKRSGVLANKQKCMTQVSLHFAKIFICVCITFIDQLEPPSLGAKSAFLAEEFLAYVYRFHKFILAKLLRALKIFKGFCNHWIFKFLHVLVFHIFAFSAFSRFSISATY